MTTSDIDAEKAARIAKARAKMRTAASGDARPNRGAAGYPGGDDATACGSVVSRRSCDGIAICTPC